MDTNLVLKRDVCVSCVDDAMYCSSDDEYAIQKRAGRDNRKLRNKQKADDFA